MCCSAKSFRFPVSGDRLLAQGISASTATSFHTSKKQQPCSINHAVQTFFFLKRLPSLHTSCARLFQSTQEKADSRLIAHSSECLRTLPVAPQHQHILVTARRTFKREEAQGTTRPTIIRMMRVEGESRTALTSPLDRLGKRDFLRKFSVVLVSNSMRTAILSHDIDHDSMPSTPDHLLSLYPHTLGRTLIRPPAPVLQQIALLRPLIAVLHSQHKINLNCSSFPSSLDQRTKLKRHIPFPMVVLQVARLAVPGQGAADEHGRLS